MCLPIPRTAVKNTAGKDALQAAVRYVYVRRSKHRKTALRVGLCPIHPARCKEPGQQLPNKQRPKGSSADAGTHEKQYMKQKKKDSTSASDVVPLAWPDAGLLHKADGRWCYRRYVDLHLELLNIVHCVIPQAQPR